MCPSLIQLCLIFSLEFMSMDWKVSHTIGLAWTTFWWLRHIPFSFGSQTTVGRKWFDDADGWV